MRIDDRILLSTVYIYQSTDAALKDEAVGGSGFVLSVPSEKSGFAYCYVVTNVHVIAKGGLTVCFNDNKGQKFPVDTRSDEWIRHMDGDDVAIIPLAKDRIPERAVNPLDASMLVRREDLDKFDIGVGDPAYMLGRFAHHEGRGRILPIARFGNIAMMPGEPVIIDLGGSKTSQECYLLDMRSINGYSGSPVIIYKAALSPRHSGDETLYWTSHWKGLLGVDAGHIYGKQKVLCGPDEHPITTDFYVQGNTAMSYVVPSYRIYDLLFGEDLMEMRKHNDYLIRLANRPLEGGVTQDYTPPKDVLHVLQ